MQTALTRLRGATSGTEVVRIYLRAVAVVNQAVVFRRAPRRALPRSAGLVGECSMPVMCEPEHGILRSWRSAQAHPETPKQREEATITRVLTTFVVVALGIYAFWGDAMGQGHVLNPFGILFLLLAALIWFGWGPICEGFKSIKDESDIPISRLGQRS